MRGRGFFASLCFGVFFGFCLSRAGATRYDYILNMFLLRDLHLMGVMAVAIAAAAPALALLKRSKLRSLSGAPLELVPKPRHPGNIWGGLLFGVGWALSGTCPGTALAQLGEGKLLALFTLGGMLAGTAIYERLVQRRLSWLAPSATPKNLS